MKSEICTAGSVAFKTWHWESDFGYCAEGVLFYILCMLCVWLEEDRARLDPTEAHMVNNGGGFYNKGL